MFIFSLIGNVGEKTAVANYLTLKYTLYIRVSITCTGCKGVMKKSCMKKTLKIRSDNKQPHCPIKRYHS